MLIVSFDLRDLNIFVVLMRLELIVHHQILDLCVFLVSSDTKELLGFYVFFHLNQLLLVDIIRVQSLKCFMNILINISVINL